MNQKTKRILIFTIVLAISAVFTRCQNDDNLANQEVSKISLAKEWFKEYESNGDNFNLFQNLNYQWANAKIKNTKEGVQIIVIPITAVKINQNENWEQKLYIYNLPQNKYTAILYEFYPDTPQIAAPADEPDNFTGYITGWDLKQGFIKAARFENDAMVCTGTIEIIPYKKANNSTARAPVESDPYEYGCSQTGCSDALPLRPVVIQNDYRNNTIYYTPRGQDVTGGDHEDYTSDHTGGGGGSSSTTNPTVATPCDKIKTLRTNANFTAKHEELKKKTGLKIESGYMQSRNGPFTALVAAPSTDNADKMNLPSDANTIGYMHTHLDPYERIRANGELESIKPIRMFSPEDVKQFIILVLSAQRNSIPIDDIYGTVVSSKGTYQLRFTGTTADVGTKANNINWQDLEEIYKNLMRRNSLEKGFLKFLNEEIGINGIELYKIEAAGNSRKTLDTNGKITTTNCN
ncbi:hypothetical protein [Flavobacterium branchiicola]|uniref:Lipoprotein n=1 Tax=Flavobacterium branchiicola TaxID=1114875 RepID=A0ABV9PKL2_9FLAO|nr:hypothetical protein [Flavobacterium branchiicola]MBS7256493.1 hypothetical protein [Flavobacterium branchiicola]